MTLYEPPTETHANGSSSNGSSSNGSSSNGSSGGGSGGGGSGGGGASSRPQRPPKPGGISIRPAMVVVGIAGLLVVLFAVGGITSPRTPPPPNHVVASSAVPGTGLRAESAASLLSPIFVRGEPPSNVRAAVFVPTGSTRIAHRDNSGGSGAYDSQVEFRSDASQAALLDFFAADMKLEGWQVFDRGPAAHEPNSFEVLGKLAGADGYFWEMGATVAPTSFAGGPASGQTDFTVRLFQIQDEQ